MAHPHLPVRHRDVCEYKIWAHPAMAVAVGAGNQSVLGCCDCSSPGWLIAVLMTPRVGEKQKKII